MEKFVGKFSWLPKGLNFLSNQAAKFFSKKFSGNVVSIVSINHHQGSSFRRKNQHELAHQIADLRSCCLSCKLTNSCVENSS